MAYSPEPVPLDRNEHRAWIERELRRISGEFEAGVEVVLLMVRHVSPDKPRDGMVVLADGTDWNPGSGGGYYGYRAGSWRFLG